jgi:DsbC/DsbD-like thiol-disulfide interchange protein
MLKASRKDLGKPPFLSVGTHWYKQILTALAFGLWGTTSLLASSPQPQDIPVALDLLADRTAVTQGGVIRLGVRFQIAPAWHIYWKNPGESGFATKIEWDLGEITTSSVETVYPVPVVFRGAGGVISYGYAGETLLFVTVRDVTLRPEAKNVKVRARVRWLMCREDECRDARKSLEMELPVGEAQPANREIFERFASLVPVEGIPENVRVDTTITSSGLTAELRAEVPPKTFGIVREDSGEARGLYFFPNPVKGWIVDTPKLVGKVSEVATKVGRLKVFAEQPTVSIQARRTSSTTSGPVEISGVLVQQFVKEDRTLTPVEIREFSLTAGK